MMEPLYVPGATPLHRLPAWIKLLALMAAGAGLFLLRDPVWLALALGFSAALVWSTGVGAAAVWRQVRGLIWILLAVASFTGWFQGPADALAVVLRVAAMVGLALAVTLATRTSDLIAVCEGALRPLERTGLVDAEKVALALAVATGCCSVPPAGAAALLEELLAPALTPAGAAGMSAVPLGRSVSTSTAAPMAISDPGAGVARGAGVVGRDRPAVV